MQKTVRCCYQNSICIIAFIFGLATQSLKSQDLENIDKQQPIKLSGGLSVLGNFYSVSGIPPRSKPFMWSINGSPTLTILGVSLPFYFNVGAQNSSFSQPFNQFGVSPHYKWLTAHLGYRSLNFSSHTLSGIVMLGGGLEVRAKKFRFAAIAGRINKAVRADTSQSFVSQQPAFKRMGFSAKIGVGTENNYFDIIVLKAKDEAASYLDAPLRLTPAENVVLGINSKLLLFKHFNLGFEVAGSAYTRNNLLDSINYKDVPIELRTIMHINISTQLLFAGNAYIGYTSKYINLKLNYKRVDQDFNSMGAYIFQTDLESFTVEPSFNLFKNKVRLSGSIGIQRDNLLRNKLSTTERTIGSVNLSVQPGRKYGLDIQYGNYGIIQRAGVIPLNDTTRLAIANQNVSAINRYSLSNVNRAVNVVLLLMYQELSSLNPFQSDQLGSNVMVGNLTTTYSLLKTGQNFTGGFNYSRTSFLSGEALLIGPSLGIGRAFLNKKLVTGINFSYMLNQFNGITAGSVINGGVNLNYRLSKTHNFLANLRLTHNGSTSPVSLPFTEMWFSAGYQFNFF